VPNHGEACRELMVVGMHCGDEAQAGLKAELAALRAPLGMETHGGLENGVPVDG
jgi:hypothetical protein